MAALGTHHDLDEFDISLTTPGVDLELHAVDGKQGDEVDMVVADAYWFLLDVELDELELATLGVDVSPISFNLQNSHSVPIIFLQPHSAHVSRRKSLTDWSVLDCLHWGHVLSVPLASSILNQSCMQFSW